MIIYKKMWFTEKIKSKESTCVVVVDESQKLEELIGPQAGFKSFLEDIKVKQTYWFYEISSQKRCLLAFAKNVSPKDTRALAKKVCAELHSLKVSNATFLFGSPFANDCSFGHFINEFASANYMRPKVGEENSKRDNVHDFDFEIDSQDTDTNALSILMASSKG